MPSRIYHHETACHHETAYRRETAYRSSVSPVFILLVILLFSLIMLFALPFAAGAQTVVLASSEGEPEILPEETIWPAGLFPAVYFTDTLTAIRTREASLPYWVRGEAEQKALTGRANDGLSTLLNNDILAFYGHPLSRNMGILGRFSIEELDKKLSELAEEYAAANGGRGIRKAFYLIYGTVWPGGDIGILREDVLVKYIEYALRHNILVFLDHQIGRFDPIDSLKRMLPYLEYPNVHLALDPEWRTSKPMEEIGTVSAEEINQAQKVMEDYIIKNRIPGERMLVIHQFNWRMISNRDRVQSGFAKVRLVHCADGFGSPHLKRSSYAYNAQASNIPVKGIKLFYNFNIPGAGYDQPLLTPQEIYTLTPRPYVIMYQ
jgi:hypothetical protein